MNVLQITDMHLYEGAGHALAGVDTQLTYEEVLAKLLEDQAWPADLILATGDLSQDGSFAAYDRFKARFEMFGVPTLVIPGNHDDTAVMRDVFRSGLVSWRRNYLLGDWQFIMLDSTIAGSPGGHLAERELVALEECLAAHPEHHAVVCLHHHPVSVACRWIDPIGVDNAEAFFAVLDRFPHVRAVVWGHIHQDFASERKGVHLLASPSTCIQFKPRQQDFALDDVPPGYRWLRLYADGRMETAVERLAGLPSSIDLQCSGY
ncbi:3',5'-cyclic-AMP phosphodiesterase [Alkalilimnicola ehrlichii]|uniref:3',5'-cyclic-AMP phosphodiesterase n=1 Tax=Alkalilimnicola ehrlichii TaxID=351052 RepID=A0A3E0X1T0_9GAMM|nr:3',5'-cyclic-AMP phosphodiesterase [Alkalilimnicola ehrlichii]RFA39619.1 3',5'-cyclic-AMP phosphodiesterase [Alkalilimnicola ehrlichii]